MSILGNERALLGYLLAKITKVDPDLIVGHNLLGFDLSTLLHRIKANNVPHWSRIGRLRRSTMPKLSYASAIQGCARGRLLCDVKVSARELIRAKNYELTELVLTQVRIILVCGGIECS